MAINNSQQLVRETGDLPVPLNIRNAPTKLMKDLGYGRGYRYAHHHPDEYVRQEYLPERLKGKVYYHPRDRGYEKIIKDRLQKWRALGKKKSG